MGRERHSRGAARSGAPATMDGGRARSSPPHGDRADRERPVAQSGYGLFSKGTAFDQDDRELYDREEDFSEANNLARDLPSKLADLVDLRWAEAGPTTVSHWMIGIGSVRPSLRMISEREFTFRAEGVLLASGSRFGGMDSYMHAGRTYFEYILSDSEKHELRTTRALAPGRQFDHGPIRAHCAVCGRPHPARGGPHTG